MTEKQDLPALLINELRLRKNATQNPLKFIGCTFEDGRLWAVKSYCRSRESDERGFYSFGKERAVSDFKFTKGLRIEELENEIKSFVERAFDDALFSAAEKLTKEAAAERILSDLDLALNFQEHKINPLFDLGILKDEKGGLKEIKYYLWVEKQGKDGPADNFSLVKALSRGVFISVETAKLLAKAQYHPTLFGTNLEADGKEEHKLYFDMGKNTDFHGVLPENTLKALDAVSDRVSLTVPELEYLLDNGLYLRGIGLNPCREGNVRLYFDLLKKRP